MCLLFTVCWTTQKINTQSCRLSNLQRESVSARLGCLLSNHHGEILLENKSLASTSSRFHSPPQGEIDTPTPCLAIIHHPKKNPTQPPPPISKRHAMQKVKANSQATLPARHIQG